MTFRSGSKSSGTTSSPLGKSALLVPGRDEYDLHPGQRFDASRGEALPRRALPELTDVAAADGERGTSRGQEHVHPPRYPVHLPLAAVALAGASALVRPESGDFVLFRDDDAVLHPGGDVNRAPRSGAGTRESISTDAHAPASLAVVIRERVQHHGDGLQFRVAQTELAVLARAHHQHPALVLHVFG
eukprot:30918-Pelagococcus_subviridis.AAC.27